MKFPRPSDWKAWQVYAASVAACAGLTAGAWAVTVRPLARQQAEARALRAELASRQRQADSLSDSLAQWGRQLEQAKAALESAPLRLEPESRINQRLAQVTTLAVDGGLLIDEMQPGTAEDGPHYRTVPVRIVGKGSYPACAAFLHRLRTRFPDTGVRSFEAAPAGPDPEAPVVTFHLELLWFTARPGK